MQPLAALALCSVLGGHRAAGATFDVFGSAPFSLSSGDESYVAVARYTDTVGIACYLGPEVEGHGERGRCNLVEGGAIVGDELLQLSDRTLHNAMASLTGATAIWCYADSENAYELKCRKVNRDGTALSVEDSGELSIKGNSVNVLGSSVISATRFSDQAAVVCADNPQVQDPAPVTTGPLMCAVLFIKPTDDPFCASCLGVNSNSGIDSMSTGPILSLSVISFTAETGAVCYTSSEDDGVKVSCTMIALSGTTEADSSLALGSTVIISESATNAAATALSADAGLVCYTEGATASCSKVELGGSGLSKAEALPVSQTAISHLTLAAFSNETVAMCFQDGATGDVACNALDVEGGTLGDALEITDAMTDQELALMSMTDSVGLVCYETTSGHGVCIDLKVLPRTTTTATSTATSTFTTTFASSTGTTDTTLPDTETETSTLTTFTSTTPHTTTETGTSTTPHTTTETTITTTLPVVDSGAGRVAGVGCAAASVLVGSWLLVAF
jgi:hypothetical protein